MVKQTVNVIEAQKSPHHTHPIFYTDVIAQGVREDGAIIELHVVNNITVILFEELFRKNRVFDSVIDAISQYELDDFKLAKYKSMGFLRWDGLCGFRITVTDKYGTTNSDVINEMYPAAIDRYLHVMNGHTITHEGSYNNLNGGIRYGRVQDIPAY